MADDIEIWRPGSFTKNFSWGPLERGLSQLHEEIRLGFQAENEDVPRTLFRQRISVAGRPDYIPVNFFLFNRQSDKVDLIVYDELVFQAQNFRHSSDFDRLALFAFILSCVGVWKNSQPRQDRPALWANAYIRERVAGPLRWGTEAISADDIEQFVKSDPRYAAKTSRKLATNLNYLYKVGKLNDYNSTRIKRWWVNALFLALDRLILDRERRGWGTAPDQFSALLASSGFMNLTGPRSLEKELAVKHLVKLYELCGGLKRFSAEAVLELTRVQLHQIQNYIETRPGAAIHQTNPNIFKTIPGVCAMLVREAGFDFIGSDELEHFDVEQFVREKTASALANLRDRGIKPTMTAAELIKLTREK